MSPIRIATTLALGFEFLVLRDEKDPGGLAMAVERFLVVDDNAAHKLFFEVLLKELGAKEIFTATTGDEGLEIVKKNHIQFIIVCWELKGIPGTIFIQKAKTARKKRYMPCLLYSKRMSEEDVRLTKELGFKDILSIPFDKDAARKIVHDMIARELNIPAAEQQLRKIEAYLSEQKPTEALKLFTNKMYEKPYTARAHALVAEVWFRLQKYDKTEESIKASLAAEENFYPALQLKAKLLSRQGQHEAAIELLTKMAALSPKNLSTKVTLGSAFVQADRHEDAKKVFREVIELDEDNQDCKDAMSVMALKEGDLSLAEQLIAETESGDEIAAAYNNLAISKVAKGEFDQGIEIYRNAIRLLADKARLHLLLYNLGLAFRKKGDLAASFAELARSYVSDPSFEKAYASLARVVQEMKEKGLAPDRTLIKEVKQARSAFKEANPSAA